MGWFWLSRVVCKRLLFEALDGFLPIWWLGLVRRDRAALAEEVESLYACDQIRRMCFESVLPYARKAWLRSRSSKSLSGQQEFPEALAEWDDFDDWLEMTLQFAYIVYLGPDALFVFPASLVSNILESKSDVFKLFCCHRHPPPEHQQDVDRDVAIWCGVLQAIAYSGLLVNGLGAVRIIFCGVEAMPFRSPRPWACKQPRVEDVSRRSGLS